MFTSMDLLIVVVMALAAFSLLALLLMFLLKNRTAQRVCLYTVAAMGVYLGTVGFRINWPMFYTQGVLAVVFALTAVAAVVLERVKKDDDKYFRLSKLLAAAAMVAGMANAFFV